MILEFFSEFFEFCWGLFEKNTKNKKINIVGKSVGSVCQTHPKEKKNIFPFVKFYQAKNGLNF
jgi:hypothetical protein